MATAEKKKTKPRKLVSGHIREVIGGLSAARTAIAGVRALIIQDGNVDAVFEDAVAAQRTAQCQALTQIFDMLGRIRSEYQTHQPERR